MIKINWLDKWALYTPDKVAIKDDSTGKDYTYKMLLDKSLNLATYLDRVHKIKKGQRIAVLSYNCIEYVILLFAVQRLGAILVPINFRLTQREIEYLINDCEPSLVIYQKEFEAIINDIGSIKNDSIYTMLISGDYRKDVISAMSEDIEIKSFPECSFEMPCMILYTSGTTGNPKGAIITNKMLFWNSINTTMRLNLSSNDITLTFAPFFHTGGWHVLLTPFIHRGAKQVLVNKFDAEKILKLCESEKVTVLFGVPTMMKMMADTEIFDEVNLSSIRFAIVGGEPMPKPLIEKWHQKGVAIRQGYGLTEVGPNCFSLQEEHSISKIGSIGFPNFYIDTKIVDDDGNEIPVNEEGELLLSGPVVMPGYWRNIKASEESIVDGWFATGDIVRKDAEGFFYVVDRKKDMYKSGGENVYPVEIEKYLYTHPAISEAAVIGIHDEKWGETGKAFIVLKANQTITKGDIIEFCKKGLAKYKIPKQICFVNELPKGFSGKILKRALKNKTKAENPVKN